MTKTIEFRDDQAAKVADKVFQDYLLYAPFKSNATARFWAAFNGLPKVR